MTTTITLSAFIVTLVVGYVIPLLTALLTKLNASKELKQLVTAALAAANGFLVTATQQDGTALFSKQSLLFAILSFITANAGYVYYGKPHNIDARLAPNVGLGKS